MRLSGVGAGFFSIDSNGTVRVTQPVDYESKKVYNLQAIATNAKADSPEASVTINVSNIAEHPPILYDFKGFVEDNATAGTIIGEVEFASRGDSLVNGFVLTGEGKENFKIDVNGTLSLSDDPELDEITQKIYSLSLVALNSAGGSAPANAEIVLTHDKTKPYKPSSMKLLDIGHNSITLGWTDNAQNERGFNLYVDGVKHATLDVNTTSYRITGLEEEATYLFTLKSFNDRGESIGASIEGITDIDRSEYLKAVLGQKCGVSASTFNSNFNADTGHYNSSISCYNKGLTDADLLNFKALKSVRYDLRLDRNNLTNLDGLSNLKSVGRNFYVYNNQLTNVDGLNKLTSVGSYFRLDGNQLTNVNGLSSLTSVGTYFYLNNNKLTNVNGLSSLTSVGNLFYLQDNLLTNVDGLSSLTNVGSHFYLYRNALTNIGGLSALTRVGGNLHVGSTQITNLDGLINLTNLGGYLAVHNNPNLVDVSGAQNIEGSNGKLLYVDLGQYTTKADENSSLCSATWDLRDTSGNVDDNMSQVCDGQAPYVPEDKEKLRDILEKKCGVTTANFYNYFNADTGHYNYHILCSSKGLTDEDLLNFKALKSTRYDVRLDRNNLTNLDGLSNLKSVGSSLQLYNNQLTNVDGLNDLVSVGYELRLDGNELTNVNGLSSLMSVGEYFYLQDNQLANVDGLSLLTNVGSHFYLYRNELTSIDGLSNLVRVGGNFHVGSNQLSNLNSLSNLITIGGYFAMHNNPNLTDVSGASNIVSAYGKLLYIDLGQYTTKADANASFCSSTWDLQDPDGNIADDMTQVCDTVEPYSPTDTDNLREGLGMCGITSATFYNTFNADTGHYNSSIYCGSKGLTDEDLLNFKALKSISGYLYLDRNNFTNVDGLSNLKSVGGHFYLYNNQLTNVDGLSKLGSVSSYFRLDGNQLTNVNGLSALRSVGSNFYLNNNQLTNVNGLSSLTSVGNYFYLQTNQLTNVDGLSSLTHVGSNFNLEGNRLTNLDGLSKLTSLGGYLAFRGNANLTDISGVSNIVGSDGKLLYINPGQYTTKADANASFCSTTWDLRDPSGNIADDMTQVCDTVDPYNPTDIDKLRERLSICGITSETFYSNFNADTGHYNSSIYCSSKGLSDEELLNFKALKSVSGYLYLDRNSLTNLDGLSNLKSVGSHFYAYDNQLANVDGLSKLTLVGSYFRLDGNQLTNVNGLSSLTSVGSYFYLNNNQLTNVNGLSSLTSVGGYLYLQTNQLTNLDGLSSLTRVGNNFNVEGNQLTNLDGLSNLTSLGGYLALRGNVNLTDISGVSNAQSSNGKLLYINPGQYTTKADANASFCSTTWDLRDPSGNIADDMTQVCDTVDPYNPTDIDKLREGLSICGITSETFYSNFNADTGHYNSSIYCSSKGLSNEELLNFKALKSVSGYLYLDRNSLTNLDGLSNLKSVGSHFYAYDNQLANVDGLSKLTLVGSYFRLDGNQLTNVNGLSSLTSVGSHFYLNNNQLTNLNGLSSLTSVGGYLYLQTNQLTNLDGLSSLTRVGNNFNVEGNQLTNLDGLSNLTSLGGYLALRNNPDLTDISGASNIVGSDGQILYITPGQYEVKANENLKLCSATWDLRDINGDINDNMTLVCGEGVALSEAQQLRAVMETKCSVSFAQFANYFDEGTGIYSSSLDCAYHQMNDDDLMKFAIVNEIQGSFSINDNNLTNLDGLSNLSSVGGYFYLFNNTITDISGLNSLSSVNGVLNLSHNKMFNLDGLTSLVTVQGIVKMYYNTNLADIMGLSNIVGIDGKKIYIDNVVYGVKAELSGALCSAKWDIYDTTGNVPDDMSKLCDGYNYVPNNTDRLRDLLGKRCSVDSSTFYSNFSEDSGIYNGDIKCQSVTDEEMTGFTGLFEVHGSFAIEDSNITTVDELIRLKNVTETLSMWNNPSLRDIDGLSNVLGVDNQRLIIDDTEQYEVKADSTKDFCATSWDIYDGTSNIVNDMSKVCSQ